MCKKYFARRDFICVLGATGSWGKASRLLEQYEIYTHGALLVCVSYFYDAAAGW